MLFTQQLIWFNLAGCISQWSLTQAEIAKRSLCHSFCAHTSQYVLHSCCLHLMQICFALLLYLHYQNVWNHSYTLEEQGRHHFAKALWFSATTHAALTLSMHLVYWMYCSPWNLIPTTANNGLLLLKTLISGKVIERAFMLFYNLGYTILYRSIVYFSLWLI